MALYHVPSSPPDLSSSKSSTKSSSVPSSSFINGDELNDISHFEDISLSDTRRPNANFVQTEHFKPRPSLRTSQTSPSLSGQARPHWKIRDSSNGLRTITTRTRPNPGLHQQATQNDSWNKSSPALNAALPIPSTSGRRSPSPSSIPGSPKSVINASTTSRAQSENSPHRPISRRGSWLPPRRKSVKELEAECNDSDDEVPDDAIISNVPLSPRPMHERSQSTSPERASVASAGISPKPPVFSRVKSWDVAMSGLSLEVKTLTEKLESHADSLDQGESSPRSRNSRSPAPSRPGMTQRRSTTVALPPIQRGDVMIDPLPASKEKEKHLTRTRPSWLPPKSKKEEKKHLQEYQKMMSKFMESERRRSQQEETVTKSKDKEEGDLSQVWTQHVLKDWDRRITTSRTRELWWRGIPPELRGIIWTRAIGNDLHLSARSYEAALNRAIASQTHLKASDGPRSSEDNLINQQERETLILMHSDIDHTFPELKVFQDGQSKHQALIDVLSAYTAYRSDTGYVRGTSSIAALLCIYITNPTDIFIAFANILNRPLSLAFCLGDTAAKDRTYRHITQTLEYKLPKLAAHFNSSSANWRRNDWLEMMCASLFSAPLGVEEASRIWDVMVFEGDGVVVRSTVGLLAKLEARLYGERSDVLDLIGWNVCDNRKSGGLDVGGPESLMQSIRWAGKEDAVAGAK